jgi:thiol-disulfide isomerase/thioredoxin
MKRFSQWIPILTVIVLIAVLNGYVNWNGKSVPVKSAPIAPVPLVGLDSKLFHLDVTGKTRLVVFWATWCGPCREEIPALMDFHRRFKDRNFEVDAVSLDEGGPSAVKPFVKAFKLPYPVYLATREAADAFGDVSSIPASFLVNSKGEIVRRYVGLQDPKVLEQDIEDLL